MHPRLLIISKIRENWLCQEFYHCTLLTDHFILRKLFISTTTACAEKKDPYIFPNSLVKTFQFLQFWEKFSSINL